MKQKHGCIFIIALENAGPLDCHRVLVGGKRPNYQTSFTAKHQQNKGGLSVKTFIFSLEVKRQPQSILILKITFVKAEGFSMMKNITSI